MPRKKRSGKTIEKKQVTGVLKTPEDVKAWYLDTCHEPF